MSLEFETLSANQLKALPIHQTVFFFPVGPLEDHGPHLPIGFDLIEARKLSQMTAQKLESELPGWVGVIMPNAPLGIETNTCEVAITVRSHVLRDWLIDACNGLKRMGFRHFVCFSGHLGPKQLTAIEDAGKIISRRPFLSRFTFPFLPKNHSIHSQASLVSACSALTSLHDLKQSPFWPDPAEHGGERDTSIALATDPQIVANSYASLITIPRESSALIRLFHRTRKKIHGYWGSPALSDPEKGNQILTESIHDLFPKLRAVWEGTNPNHLFRSWYSILPPNKSFIKGWTLAILLILMIWIYLNFLGTLFA